MIIFFKFIYLNSNIMKYIKTRLFTFHQNQAIFRLDCVILINCNIIIIVIFNKTHTYNPSSCAFLHYFECSETHTPLYLSLGIISLHFSRQHPRSLLPYELSITILFVWVRWSEAPSFSRAVITRIYDLTISCKSILSTIIDVR